MSQSTGRMRNNCVLTCFRQTDCAISIRAWWEHNPRTDPFSCFSLCFSLFPSLSPSCFPSQS